MKQIQNGFVGNSGSVAVSQADEYHAFTQQEAGMRIAIIGVTALAVCAPALAQEPDRAVRLLLDRGVMAAVEPRIQHTATETTAGVIHMPDRLRVHAVDVPASGPAAAWSASHRILVAPLSISVEPTEGRPRKVSIGLQFRSIGTASEQPVILDVHPPTEFRPAATTGEASITVTPELRFGAPGGPGLGIASSGSLTTRWQPGVPKIISGHGDATAFWQFESRQDWWPVGRLPMTVLLAVPREISEARLGLDVRVELAGGIFTSGVTGRAANIVTLILQ